MKHRPGLGTCCERPIIFSAAMVRAILEGRKTQTRRVVKPQPDSVSDGSPFANGHGYGGKGTRDRIIKCPYGSPGDRLWVREAWYYDLPPHKLPSEKPADFDPDSLYFRADGDCCQQIPECQCAEVGKPKWRSPIHMPRWASRLTLEVVGVRVERLQAISECDAIAEGVETHAQRYGIPEQKLHGMTPWYRYDGAACSAVSAVASFRSSINGKDSWDLNPWVWVVEFKKDGGS